MGTRLSEMLENGADGKESKKKENRDSAQYGFSRAEHGLSWALRIPMGPTNGWAGPI